MRRAPVFLSLILISASACGGRAHTAAPADPAAAQAPDPDYPATRWIPAQPSYAFATRSLADAQRSFGDALSAVGIPLDLDAAALGKASEQLVGVDVLSPDAVAEIGVDARAGAALFSEGASPTIVVRLASPDQYEGFVQRQRARGLATTSVRTGGAELFTARLGDGFDLQWAAADGWLWLHLDVRAAHEDPAAWFAHSRAPHDAPWAKRWQWAKGTAAAASTVVGIADVHGAAAALGRRAPALVSCANLASSVDGLAISVASDGRRVTGRLALDAGPRAAQLAALARPVPAGWPDVANRAALAAQWNVDGDAVLDAVQPCLAALAGGVVHPLSSLHVRAARVAVLAIDADGKGGQGVASLDVSSPAFFQQQLDQIPMRSALERKRKFGPYDGRALSIPFGPSIEYVVAPTAIFAAMGEGLIARVVGNGATVPGPLLAIDLRPPAMGKDAWTAALALAGIPHPARVADRLLAWRAAHLALAVDGSALVFSASGERR